jgi:hypothetical protein
MDKAQIKATMMSKGWQGILDIWEEQLVRMERVNYKDTRWEDIAVDTLANAKMRETFDRVMTRLSAIANEEIQSEISYK